MEGSRPVKGGKLEMDNPVTRISVRNLVEFILQSGDLDNRRGTIDKDAMLKGSRLHRKLQKQMGGDYRAEVALRMNYSYEDLDHSVRRSCRWNFYRR